MVERCKGVAVREDKRARFKRIVEPRVNRILYRLKVLGNCSNRAYYEWTEEEVNRIFSVIEAEIVATKNCFEAREMAANFTLVRKR